MVEQFFGWSCGNMWVRLVYCGVNDGSVRLVFFEAALFQSFDPCLKSDFHVWRERFH